ncbi:MAG TPA: 4Fe-4S binding protein [Cyclobacteriaceae bacterium]|nr:4Fe-4S binding protein [Cyclobacteriaceae bacterium]HMV08350.1 4Fe-4S binding protein [Cyclobacteriaceae bacterium]HMV88373.1 4Fe-4S binding protein [Cyclobacteriaceae bacterium]HMX02193.1 4Fe-4S binding protein [Cyclobacteriaceae bacterium]HMX49831.1 4Fe-4S binding protein [Cyclobacteriaceae bacterium]
MEQQTGYWKNVLDATRSVWGGLRLTFSHLVRARKTVANHSIRTSGYFDQQQGIATIQYPHVSIPLPDTGRYKLHNEIDDCIVCDKCAKICPVNCITIEPIKATEEIGRTSDGTPKRIYAARFDIDMGKCCFCGLCTTVCPTECLTMTKTYDFSVFDIREHNYAFAEMSVADIADKKKALEEHQKAKAVQTPPPTGDAPKTARPVFKPKIKPPGA